MLSELSPRVRYMVEERANREQPWSSERVILGAIVKLYEHEAKDGSHLSEELRYLVDGKLKSARYTSVDQVVEAALLSKESETRVEAVFNFIDRVYGLKHRGISYVILSIGFAVWVTAFFSKANISRMTLEPEEFIAALIVGLVLMIVASGIRVYEFMVITRFGTRVANEESDSNQPT